MRVVRLADAPVVVHVRRNDDVVVGVPDRLSEGDILAMASVVLTEDEFAELAGSLGRGHGDHSDPFE
jgi:hypothetical protein